METTDVQLENLVSESREELTKKLNQLWADAGESGTGSKCDLSRGCHWLNLRLGSGSAAGGFSSDLLFNSDTEKAVGVVICKHIQRFSKPRGAMLGHLYDFEFCAAIAGELKVPQKDRESGEILLWFARQVIGRIHLRSEHRNWWERYFCWSCKSWLIFNEENDLRWEIRSSDKWALGGGSLVAIHSSGAEFPFRTSGIYETKRTSREVFGDARNVLSRNLGSEINVADIKLLFLSNLSIRFFLFDFDYQQGN